MSSITKENILKKGGIAEVCRWHNVVTKEKQKHIKTSHILLPPDFLKKECLPVYPESKYFVR
ncbi:MAG: hypothetical protein CXT73_05340 [Methanobacteriota archaeon]|nr:MAG: hypothetical protein CXT73_05340 [Euryarchaeota archaeon]